MKNQIYYILILILLGSCQFNSEKKESSVEVTPTPKLTSIDGFPDEIDGCSCYFSKDSLEFKNHKFLYLDTYYSGTAFVKINEKIIKIDLEDKTKSDFEVEIIFETDKKTSSETWWKTGKIKVIMPDGQILTESFIGECGC